MKTAILLLALFTGAAWSAETTSPSEQPVKVQGSVAEIARARKSGDKAAIIAKTRAFLLSLRLPKWKQDAPDAPYLERLEERIMLVRDQSAQDVVILEVAEGVTNPGYLPPDFMARVVSGKARTGY